MKWVWMIVLGCLGVGYAQPLTEVKDFGSNPGNLRMYQYVPARKALAGEGLPLVVVLHGCSQQADNIAKLSGWNQLADQYGFAVLYPQQKRINNASNCFNWFQEEDIDSSQGETASILQMIRQFCATHRVDSTRIFVYGVSAGAAMAVSLLANAPCQLQSGAILAGGPYKAATSAGQALKTMRNPPDLSPQEWASRLPYPATCTPSLVVLHGTEDNVVDPRSSRELIDQWCGLHGIAAQPDSAFQNFEGIPLVSLEVYRNAQQESVIRYYSVRNTGHAIPVYPGSGPRQGGETGIFAVDRAFFSTWFIARDWGLAGP